jgi:hypothetical protein
LRIECSPPPIVFALGTCVSRKSSSELARECDASMTRSQPIVYRDIND